MTMPEEYSSSPTHQEDNLTVGARGGAVAFGLKISNTALAFINQILLARILGAGGLGEVILAVTVIRIAVQIAKFGMEEAMMKFIPIYIEQNKGSLLKGAIIFAVQFSLLVSAVFVTLIFLSSNVIALNIFKTEGLIKLLPVIVVAIPAWVTRDVIGGVLRGHRDVMRAMIPEAFVSPVVKIVIFLLLTLRSISPVYAVIAFVAGEVLAATVSIVFLMKITAPLKLLKPEFEYRKIFDIAYTIIFTSMSVLLYTQADVWILGMYASTEVVGIYGVSAKLVLLVYFPMMAFASIIPSIISSVHASGNTAELRKVTRESTRWILSMSLPIILILWMEGRYLLKYVYGSQFMAGYIPLLILVSGQFVKAGAGLIGVLLQMTGEHKIYMKVNIVLGIINIVLNLLLVPRYGMIGAAAATAFCLSMVDIICIIIIKKRLSILTLARGFSFDILFVLATALLYLSFGYVNLHAGQHMLFIVALSVYLWKSMKNQDIPWHYLLPKKENQ